MGYDNPWEGQELSFDCYASHEFASSNEYDHGWNFAIVTNSGLNSFIIENGFEVKAPSPLPPFYRYNVTATFVAWFGIGFFIQIIGVLACFLSCCSLILKELFCLKIANGCFAAVQCVGGLAWFIYGQVIRWRLEGQICSGKRAQPKGPYTFDGG